MLFIYIGVVLLCLTVLLVYCHSIYIAFLLFILFLCTTQFDNYRKSYFYKDNHSIPRYSPEELYHECKHGDIIFNCRYYNPSINIFYHYFNYRISHGVMIIEENNKKYVLETNGSEIPWNSERIMSISNDIYNNSCTWDIRKTLLIEYVKIWNTQILHIYRQPTHIPPIQLPNNMTTFYPISISKINIYYCTLLIGDILVHNHIIPTSTKLFRYQTSDLIYELKKSGYTSFLCII